MRIEAITVPRRRALSKAPIFAFTLPTRTANMPMMEAIIPPPATSMGRNQAVVRLGASWVEKTAIAPSAMVAIIEST